MPEQNYTSDSHINEISIQQERIVISKDSDFVDSLLTIQRPYKLLLITTGNIKNTVLEELVASQLSKLVDLFEQYKYIELTLETIIVHQ